MEKIEDDVEIALKRAMPKHTWKSRDISSGVEKFENIVYDIVKKHCFIEPSNSKWEKPKLKKGCCFGKVKTPEENTSQTSSQDEEEKSRRWSNAERTIQSHPCTFFDYLKLSKKSSEKVGT